MARHYRPMTQFELNTLKDHAKSVGAEFIGGTNFSAAFKMGWNNTVKGGQVRDSFLRDLPAMFSDVRAEVKVVDYMITIRMRHA